MTEGQACCYLDLRDFGGVSHSMGCGLTAKEHGTLELSQLPSVAEYQYQPLSGNNGNEIRLVRLHPRFYKGQRFEHSLTHGLMRMELPDCQKPYAPVLEINGSCPSHSTVPMLSNQ